jgi:hypothetical protein
MGPLRRFVVIASVSALCLVAIPALAASPPPGATALCRDGTYSYSLHHSGSCSHHGGVAAWLDGGNAATGSPSPPAGAAALPPDLGRTVLLAPRTKTSHCTRSPNPDRRCSPGASYSGLSRAVLCSSTFRTSQVRNVPDSEKHAVEVEYGMTPRPYGRTIEIDHIVSLELGGSNDIANLYPEPGSGPASYHVKDRLENKLHGLVCSGAMTLHAAQAGIASNWQALFFRVFGVSSRG